MLQRVRSSCKVSASSHHALIFSTAPLTSLMNIYFLSLPIKHALPSTTSKKTKPTWKIHISSFPLPAHATPTSNLCLLLMFAGNPSTIQLWLNASVGFILFSGSHSKHRLTKSISSWSSVRNADLTVLLVDDVLTDGEFLSFSRDFSDFFLFLVTLHW